MPRLVLALILVLALAAPALAADPPEVVSGVPADVFNFVCWAAGVIIAAEAAGIVALFRTKIASIEVPEAPSCGLTPDEHEALIWLRNTHDSRDENGILNWVYPREHGVILKKLAAAAENAREASGIRTEAQQREDRLRGTYEGRLLKAEVRAENATRQFQELLEWAAGKKEDPNAS